MTAHRAKGLEFDHVAVLDGGWERIGPGEDPDAPRRLYYVAMTRARRTLALARLEGTSPRPGFVREPGPPAYSPRRHPLSGALSDTDSVLHRHADGEHAHVPELARRYRRPGLHEINLGFAGRRRATHPVHRAIAALSPGDPLGTRIDDAERFELLDRSGTVVGRLARVFAIPPATRCRAATVRAVVTWSREDSEAQYREGLKCDTWEVVVPELVFAPDG